MYSYVRLTHIFFYNQSDGLRLSEQFFTRNLLLYKYIFHLLAYNYCNATLRCPAATYYAAISLFTLYNNYVSYFVVKCDLALLLLRQGMCNVT